MKVDYEDFDGLSMLVDATSLRRRYAEHYMPDYPEDEQFTASVAADVTKTTCELLAAGEAAAWGTHQCGSVRAHIVFGESSPELRQAYGAKSVVEAGVIEATGPVAVIGWGSFTYMADYGRGELDPATLLEVDSGRYRVVVHRPFDAGDDVFDGAATFIVELHPTDAPYSETSEIPGADGWL